MNFAFKIFPEKGLIIESITGSVTADELMGCFERVWNHPHYHKNLRGLSDVCGATFNMTLKEFRNLEQWMYAHPLKCNGRWAWVADAPTPTAYGILHQKKSSQQYPFSVFSDWKNGFRWVQCDYDPELISEVRKSRKLAAA